MILSYLFEMVFREKYRYILGKSIIGIPIINFPAVNLSAGYIIQVAFESEQSN